MIKFFKYFVTLRGPSVASQRIHQFNGPDSYAKLQERTEDPLNSLGCLILSRVFLTHLSNQYATKVGVPTAAPTISIPAGCFSLSSYQQHLNTWWTTTRTCLF